jgi:hypothetical protein
VADQWYYSSGGQQQGPVDWDKLQGLAQGGKLQRSDMVWKEGMAEWKPASGVEGLSFAAGPSPGPSPAPFGGPPPSPQYGGYGYAGGGSQFFSKIGLDGILAASGALAMLLGTFLPWLSVDLGNKDESAFGVPNFGIAQLMFVGAFAVLALVAIRAFVTPSATSRANTLTHGIHLTWMGGVALLLAIIFLIGKPEGADLSFGPFFSLIGAGVLLAGGIIALVKGVATRA